MKRIICFAMCAVAAMSVCACGSDSAATPTEAQPATSAVSQIDETAAPTEGSTELSLKSFVAGFDTEPTVSKKLLYEDENLSVTVTGIAYNAISGPGLQLTIDNRYKKDIVVQAPYAVVNGYMISPEISIEVPAEKSAEGVLTLPYFNLAIADITSLEKIEFAMRDRKSVV